MIHVSSCVSDLEIRNCTGRAQTRASPCRDTIAQDHTQRHTQRVSFEQGPITSVRVELEQNRNLTCRCWTGFTASSPPRLLDGLAPELLLELGNCLWRWTRCLSAAVSLHWEIHQYPLHDTAVGGACTEHQQVPRYSA